MLEAWHILRERGLNQTLHLTISSASYSFLKKLEDAIKSGLSIVNHGSIPFYEVINIYTKCKATIYPSHDESLGLGLLEAIHTGCDVIASDLPFVHAICKPSATFKVKSPESIANAIINYEKNIFYHSELTINNEINSLIQLLN